MNNTDIATVKEESRQLDHMTSSRLTDSLFSKDLAPHYMKLAGQLAASEMVPKCYRNKPADLFLCWSMGYQIGIPPEQAMNCIMVTNGKASMWGDEMLALCMAHPDFIDIIEEPILANGETVTGYRCTVKRKHKTDVVSIFTLDMAKKAGLLAKGGTWSQYPERMLKVRARGFALRDAFPDALKGIKSREEVEDYIDADYTENKPSRTEALKEQLAIKMNADATNQEPIGSVLQEDEKPEIIQNSNEKTNELHIKIKQLIEEKSFSEEQLKKALKFYNVNSIDEMDWEAAHHFALKLNK